MMMAEKNIALIIVFSAALLILTFAANIQALGICGPDYDNYKKITITNNNVTEPLDTDYTYNFTADTTNSTKFYPNGSNVLFLENMTGVVNYINWINLTPFGTTNTKLDLSLGQSIAAGSSNDSIFFCYTSTNETGKLNNKSRVYNYTDDFESYSLNTDLNGQNGWSTSNTNEFLIGEGINSTFGVFVQWDIKW